MKKWIKSRVETFIINDDDDEDDDKDGSTIFFCLLVCNTDTVYSVRCSHDGENSFNALDLMLMVHFLEMLLLLKVNKLRTRMALYIYIKKSWAIFFPPQYHPRWKVEFKHIFIRIWLIYCAFSKNMRTNYATIKFYLDSFSIGWWWCLGGSFLTLYHRSSKKNHDKPIS